MWNKQRTVSSEPWYLWWPQLTTPWKPNAWFVCIWYICIHVFNAIDPMFVSVVEMFVIRINLNRKFMWVTISVLNRHFRKAVEKAMAPHFSTLAWKIPWTEEPGRLQSMGSLRVGHDWVTSLSLFIFMHWRRKWQPLPVFLPGESQGRGSLVGCRLWGCTELNTTEAT